jgi:hypothetical protein
MMAEQTVVVQGLDVLGIVASIGLVVLIFGLVWVINLLGDIRRELRRNR